MLARCLTTFVAVLVPFGAVCSATGIESDHMDISRQAVVRGGSVWLVIEHVFAAIFSIEMCVRWRCQLHPRGCTAAA